MEELVHFVQKSGQFGTKSTQIFDITGSVAIDQLLSQIVGYSRAEKTGSKVNKIWSIGHRRRMWSNILTHYVRKRAEYWGTFLY